MNFRDPFGINKRTKRVSPAMTLRKNLYNDLKQQGVKVSWNKTKTSDLQKLSSNRKFATRKLSNFITNQSNKKLINKINNLNGPTTLPIFRFNQIINQIQATTERYMVVRKLDLNGGPKADLIKLTKTFFENNEGGRDRDQILHLGYEGAVNSGADFEIDEDINGSIEIEWVQPSAKSRSEVEFFRYLTNIDYDLKDFQVFTHGDKIDDKPCFIKALEMNNVSKDIINNIITSMYKNAASMSFIKATAEKFNLYFEIQTTGKNILRYGNPEHQNVALGIVADHIFANFETNITETALLHPEYANHEFYPNISIKSTHGKKYIRQGKYGSQLSSFRVINFLYKKRDTLLTPITLQNAPKLINNKFAECSHLGNEINEEEIDYTFGDEPEVAKEFNHKHVCCADLETLTIDNVHTPYCACWSKGDGIIKVAYGFDCVEKMLKDLDDDSLIWFHNLGFDIRFFIKYLSISWRDTLIETGNSMKRLSGKYYGKSFTFQDTKAFLNNKLCDMPAMFNFENLDKECFPHDLMTKDNFNKPMRWSYIKANFKDHETLRKNAFSIQAMFIGPDGKYYLDIPKYAKHYCKKDVEVLEKCFSKFRMLVKDRFEQDSYCFVSIPSLSQAILKSESCFLGCVSLKGELLNFCRKAIVGGRVMTCENKKWSVQVLDDHSIINGQRIEHHQEKYTQAETNLILECVKQGGISDFDAVSLYPSAMARLIGFPIGAPIITKDDPNTIPFNGDLIASYADDQDKFTAGTYHISRVLVKSLNKPRKFPLQSVMTEQNTRDFTNDIVGREIVMDQYAIEDLIKFQEVEVEYIESLVWRHGFNNQITKTIKKLFAERLVLKEQGNALQECIKLLMNAAYGKLIQKPIVQTKKIVVNYPPKKGEEFKDNIKKYMSQSIKRLISRHDIATFSRNTVGVPDNTVSHALFIEHKPLIEHSSPAHLGVSILSMSKRIMNEVMCLSEDLGMNMYYQDTDSIHIEQRCVNPLGAFYKETYGRELIGNGLGQFHTDFELKNEDGKKIKGIDIWATESIFLGKKCYMDKLISNKGHTGYHVRMKGIPSKLITNPHERFKNLFNGGTEYFDLSECCPISINNKSQVVMKRTEFTREIQFK